MSINNKKPVIRHLKSTLDKIKSKALLPFSTLLPKSKIEKLTKDLEYRERVFTPAETVYAFLGQVTSADQSCQNAVAQVLAHVEQQQSAQISANTSAYCQARKRLPKTLLPSLCKEVAQDLEEQAPEALKWRKRSVKIADGTTASMPDTVANQAVYPQPRTQKKGLDSLCSEWWVFSR